MQFIPWSYFNDIIWLDETLNDNFAEYEIQII
jgi:hypothetical protein